MISDITYLVLVYVLAILVWAFWELAYRNKL